MMETDSIQFDEDVTDVPSGMGTAARRPPRQTVRIGRLAVPASLFAWGVSLSAHAAIVAAACVGWQVYRVFHPTLQVMSEPVGVALSDEATGQGLNRELPIIAAPPTEPEDETPRVPREAEGLPQEENERPRTAALLVIDPDEQPPSNAIIGAVSAGDFGSPSPRHVGGRHGPVAKAKTGGGASGGEDSDTPPNLLAPFGGHGLPMPSYPIESRRRGEQGVVKVELEILPDGHLGRIRVVSDGGFPRLARAALDAAEALRRHVFPPATHGGKPVTAVQTIPYNFFLR